jgi:nucleotide-binding universal stress UspA family protein
MANFGRILFPVDFSDRCSGAAHYVVDLARRFGSELILTHVLETPIARPGELDFGALAFETDREVRLHQAEEMLAAFLASEPPGISIARHVKQGDPARAIVRLASDEAVDLIAMPTHGYGAFRRFILGSVTAKVLHDAECAVWTGVHMENAPAPDAIAYRNVICAVDNSDSAGRPLRAAAEFVRQVGGELTVVHAIPMTDAVPERLMDRELRMYIAKDARDRLQSKLDELGMTARLCIEGGDTAKVVRMAAEQHNGDILFIGRSNPSGLTGRLRTHSYAIIRESPCPVISV